MKRLLGFSLLSGLLLCGSVAQALENWTEVTINPVGDRFLIFDESIQQAGETVQFWEYRYFEQPNNEFLTFEVEEPVYGVMLYQSGNCASGIVETQKIIVFDQEQQQIQEMDYDGRSQVSQPMEGSSAAKVLSYVCSN
ncbi:MAG: hypothetical protein Kow00121_37040 [Elainellaceae cyanobacterium]